MDPCAAEAQAVVDTTVAVAVAVAAQAAAVAAYLACRAAHPDSGSHAPAAVFRCPNCGK